jgi:hypothetical protein
MAVWIVEVDATAAILPVDLAQSRPIELSIEVDAAAVDARESRIEFSIADEEGALKGPASPGIGKIEC